MINLNDIKSFGIFEGLSDNEISNFINISSLSEYSKDQIIFEKDTVDDVIFIVIKGTVEVCSLSDSNGVKFTFAKLEKGMFFGEMSFLDNLPRSASVKALEKSEIMTIDKKSFNELIETNPKSAAIFLKNLGRIISIRLRNIDKFIINILRTWEHYSSKWEKNNE